MAVVHVPAPVRRVAEAITGVAGLREELRAERANGAFISESVADLERQLFEPNWLRLTAASEIEFSTEGLQQLRAICRLYSIKNALIKRGLNLRSAYVWGQGVEIAARANGKQGGNEQDVQAVIDAFLTDDANSLAATGSAARSRLEKTLGTDGEVFLAAVTRPMTGEVQVRVILADEIWNIISNPEDRADPWYYHRKWVEKRVDGDGYIQQIPRERYYPALGYRPAARPRSIGSVDVQWDTPILHVLVNNPEGWTRGIPDAYAAIDWAKAYKEFLEDWARLMRALSRYAWKATAPGSKAAGISARVAASPSRSIGGELNTAGATLVIPPDVAMEAISKSGATIDSESGRPLAMMVASALGVPVTMLLADPGQTGARATAETLDQPTSLEMDDRRALWADAYRRLFRYIIIESVRAPQGALRGTIKRDPFSGRESVTLAGDTDDTIDIVFPSLDKVTPDILVKAIVEAAGVGVIPPEQIARLLLQALRVRDVDEILDSLMVDGVFQYPRPPNLVGAGQAALDAARSGGDPAAAGDGGSMLPDDTGAPGGGTASDGGDQANAATDAPPAGGGRQRGG